MATVKTILSKAGQSVHDIALQFYGDLSGLGKVIRSVDNLDTPIPMGTAIVVDVVNEPVVLHLEKYKIDPVSIDEEPAEEFTVDSDEVTVDSDLITADQTIS